MTEDDEYLKCPTCAKEVKKKNLEKHLQRVHEMSKTDIKSLKAELDRKSKKRNSKKKGKKGELKKDIISLIVAIMIIGTILYTYVKLTGENDIPGPSNGGDGILDPTRVEFTTNDGFLIVGNYYIKTVSGNETPVTDRPILILSTGMNEVRSVWKSKGLVDSALNWGFNVLIYDMRGHGESKTQNGRKIELDSMTTDEVGAIMKDADLDVRAAVDFVNTNFAYNGEIAVVGASVGANAVLNAAVYDYEIQSLVLLSPSKNYWGLTTTDPIRDTGNVPVFIAAGSNEVPVSNNPVDVVGDCKSMAENATYYYSSREVKLEFYTHENPSEFLHGTNLFKITDFETDLEAWLKKTMID